MSTDQRSFHTTIGVEVKGETWSCVEIPGSAEFFGTGKTVRVDALIAVSYTHLTLPTKA